MSKTVQPVEEPPFKLDPKSLEEKRKTEEKVSSFNLVLISTVVSSLQLLKNLEHKEVHKVYASFA